MIQIASWPKALSTWNPKDPEHPYYLEIFGETAPMLDTGFGSLDSSDTQPSGNGPASPLKTYDYWWTLAHAGYRQNPHSPLDYINPFESPEADPDSDRDTIWSNLYEKYPDVAARVYMYFPMLGGWRIREIGAALHYLRPVWDHRGWMEEVVSEWTKMEPVLKAASQLAGAAAGISPIASAGATARLVDMVSAVASLQFNSIPQSKLPWAVEKMSSFSHEAGGAMQGIAWTLPREVFVQLGGRINGSVRLSFIPADIQHGEEVTPGCPKIAKLPLVAHSVVFAKDRKGEKREYWAPAASNRFVHLYLQPRFGTERGDEG